MRKGFLSLAILSVAVCNIDCDGHHHSTTGYLSITVVDSLSGNPIPCVSLWASNSPELWGATGLNGTATFNEIIVGTYGFFFNASRYRPDTATIIIEKGQQYYDIRLSPLGDSVDNIRPQVIYVMDNIDYLNILFSERMNRLSVESESQAAWMAGRLCYQDGSMDSSYTFSTEWTADNIVRINHFPPTHECRESNGGGWDNNKWIIVRFELDTMAMDYSGNHLLRPLYWGR